MSYLGAMPQGLHLRLGVLGFRPQTSHAKLTACDRGRSGSGAARGSPLLATAAFGCYGSWQRSVPQRPREETQRWSTIKVSYNPQLYNTIKLKP